MTNKYNIDYIEIELNNKPLFIFVNHKTAVLCWTQILNWINKKTDVIHFDSHGDFRGGVINGETDIAVEPAFGSKYLPPHLKHFSKCKEFIAWDMLDSKQNTKFITQEKKFLFAMNDNFIDVAFMKNAVSNVYWYFIKSQGDENPPTKCEDINDNDHNFIKLDVKKFKQPKNQFILDIDLDFFVIDKEENCEFSPFSEDKIRKYLSLQKKLFLSDLCVGLTIALEPGCCGGEDNCLLILKKLCEEFNVDLIQKATDLIKKAN